MQSLFICLFLHSVFQVNTRKFTTTIFFNCIFFCQFSNEWTCLISYIELTFRLWATYPAYFREQSLASRSRSFGVSYFFDSLRFCLTFDFFYWFLEFSSVLDEITSTNDEITPLFIIYEMVTIHIRQYLYYQLNRG